MDRGLMTGIYRREGEWTLVEMKVSHPAQLFNSLDPSPFRERDLDAEAAAWLVDALRELHGHDKVKVVVYLPGAADERTHVAVTDAIRNFFRYREQAAQFALRQVLRYGRLSLAVGLLFLAVCTVLWRFVFTGEALVDRILGEGFLIMGWVAMWKPLEILLYDWWPVLRDIRLYRRIAALPVEIRSLARPS
ncbi:MAG: hypothetical protein ACLGHJ_08930 [Gammaproteobacteria bacterium]